VQIDLHNLIIKLAKKDFKMIKKTKNGQLISCFNALQSMLNGECDIKSKDIFLYSIMVYLFMCILPASLQAAEFSIYRDGNGFAVQNQMGKKIDNIRLIDINGQSVDVLAVKDEKKCPERVEGEGAGDYIGGKCYFPKPTKGCSSLGDDCSDVYGEDTCRCDAKNGVPGGGLLDSAVTLPAY